MIQRVLEYLRSDLWRIRLRELPRRRSIGIQVLRVIVLSLRGFDEDKCLLRASALTFFTLLSIVPVLALAFGIAKGFGFHENLEAKILELSQGQEEAFKRIIEFSNNLLDNTQGGLIAGIGVALLLWSVIKLLGNIEKSFNEIWGIKKARSWGRKLSDYLSFMLIAPILFIMAGSVTVMIMGQVQGLVERLSFLGPVQFLIFGLMRLLPFVVVWSLFTFMYIFMPNGKVKFTAALLGGIIAGTMYQLWQWLYIGFQIGVAKYNAIYGSFAALPLFLIWLQVSWLTVLYGAEISFAKQNVETYEFEPDCLRVSAALKQRLSLGIVQLCVKRFQDAEPPPTATALAHALATPIRLVSQILYELVEAGVLAEVSRNSGDVAGYQPAQNVEELTIQRVLDLINRHGEDDLPYRRSEEMEKLASSLEAIAREATASKDNLRIKDL